MTSHVHHHIISIRLILTLGVLVTAVILCNYLSIDPKSTRSTVTFHHNNVKPHTLLKHIQTTQKPKPIAVKQNSRPTHPHTPLTTPDVLIPPPEAGLVPIITSLPTKKPVVFLTIDDGAHKTPDQLQTMRDNHLVASIFLARLFITDNPDYFAEFTKYGNLIENHSLDHFIDPTSIESYDLQKQQICGMADYEQRTYGRRPIFFRPPGGAYSVAMRRAAADCGMKAIVTWIAKANGGSMQYQIGDHLRPGDVVLMHFRPEFQQDIRAFLDAMNSQHLHTELLENWMPAR